MNRGPVALATCAEHPSLPPGERVLLEALRRRGVDAEPAVWERVAEFIERA